jgi:polyferredoxin
MPLFHTRPPSLEPAPAKRRWVQFGALAALLSSWGPQAKAFCLPVMNCHSCALAWFACPIGVLIHFAGFRVFPFLALGTLLLIGVLFGRLLCGWACPMGLLQDLLFRLPGRKIELPRWTAWIKYALLVIMVGLLPFLWGETTLASFCRICPTSAIQVTLPGFFTGAIKSVSPMVALRLAILAGVLALAIVSSRSFCRVMCPIGALLAPLNYLSFWKVNPRKDNCLTCGACDKACPTRVVPSTRL